MLHRDGTLESVSESVKREHIEIFYGYSEQYDYLDGCEGV